MNEITRRVHPEQPARMEWASVLVATVMGGDSDPVWQSVFTDLATALDDAYRVAAVEANLPSTGEAREVTWKVDPHMPVRTWWMEIEAGSYTVSATVALMLIKV